MMTELPFYNKILILLINFITIWLAIIVYNNDRKGELNKIFLGMMISMFLWVDFAYLARLVGQQAPDLGLVFLKIAWSFSPFLFISFYFLIIFYLNKEKQYSVLNKVIFLSGLIIFLVTISTNLVIREMEFVGVDLAIIYGKGILPFFGIIFFFMCISLYLLFKEYTKCMSKKKVNIEYLLAGISIFYLANIIFGIIFPVFFKIVHLYWIGDYSAIFLLGFTAYAITKHELMGVKTLVTQVLIVIILIVLLVDLLILTDEITMQLLKSGVLVAFLYFSRGMVESVRKEKKARAKLEDTYKKIDRYVEKLENVNINLKEKNEDLEALLKSDDVIAGTLDPKKIAQDVVDSIPNNLRHLGYKGGVLTLYNKNKKTVSTYAITESAIVKKAKKLLGKSFEKHSESIKTNNLTIKTIKTKKMQTGSKLEDFIAPTVSVNICKMIQKLIKAKSFISLPIFSSGRVIGVLIFIGVKPEKEITQRDREILFGFSSHVGASIENAELYKKTDSQMSELEKLNNSLKKANQKLKELLEVKNEFLHITSHQLRTPLTTIRGMISMWREGSFDNLSKKKKKEMLKDIYISAERLNNITNDMLDSLELEGGVFKFQFKQVSLEKAIEDSISVLKFNYDKKGLYLNFNTKGKNIPVIEAEPGYTRQIFMNLIDNACKYTDKGGVKIDIKKSGKNVEITVKDTGIGLSKKDQKTIFQKFTRSEEAMIKNVAGSGLGLFIVKKIVKAHHGKIEFYSEGEGKGSTVKVWLPIRQK
ncbi:MAG: ATP-binding protein [Patescibacteria group bacterium]|nr:ATP-binding protein [Patescibacteria group bacterium]